MVREKQSPHRGPVYAAVAAAVPVRKAVSKKKIAPKANACTHPKPPYKCAMCRKSNIPCEHKPKRTACSECEKQRHCPHGRRKDRCKECGCKSLCSHGRRPNYCAECGGT